MKIEKKIWPEYFELVKAGKKNFELRIADFECKEGDVLVLKEWAPKKKEYTGRLLERSVSFVIKTDVMNKFHSKEELAKYGLQVIGFETMKRPISVRSKKGASCAQEPQAEALQRIEIGQAVLDILDPKLAKRAEKYIEKGSYKDITDFINRAAETLLMAEDVKPFFGEGMKELFKKN